MSGVINQFKNLNPNDPGSWPPLPKLTLLTGLFLAVLIAAYFFDWQGQVDELRAGQEQEVKLKQDYVAKKGIAINLDLYKQQLTEINSSFGALLKQLPNKSQMEALIIDINQAGLGRGLQFELFKPAPSENVKEFYAELPISIRLTGSYHDMGAFASDIGQLPRVVTLNDISLTTNKDGNLVMDTVAKTFRYLDEDELALQRAATANKTAKAKGKK